MRLGEALRPAEQSVETAVKERVAVDLPEPFEQVKTGGAGRFLIFYLKNAKKLAIFDVYQARMSTKSKRRTTCATPPAATSCWWFRPDRRSSNGTICIRSSEKIAPVPTAARC